MHLAEPVDLSFQIDAEMKKQGAAPLDLVQRDLASKDCTREDLAQLSERIEVITSTPLLSSSAMTAESSSASTTRQRRLQKRRRVECAMPALSLSPSAPEKRIARSLRA